MIADADVLELDHVLVVQRRHAHDHAADGDRLEHRVRIQGAGPPHVQADVDQPGDGRRGRELEGDRPARVASDRSERLLLVAAVDLDDAAVDVVVELAAQVDEALAGLGHALERLVAARQRIDREALFPQPREDAPVRLELDPLERTDAVGEQRERTRRRHRGILLAQRPRRRVARVHEHAETGLEALLVEPLEGRERQVDLAAHLDERGPRVARETPRQRVDRAQVRRDVLADQAVAARRAAREYAVAIDERDREPVDLRLGDVGDVVVEPALGEQAPRARVPCGQLVAIARVGEREHRLQVLGGREPLGGARAHALRRRVGRSQLGLPLLELHQLAVERVVLRVRDLRLVELVVEPQMASRARSAATRRAAAGSSAIGGEDVSELGRSRRDGVGLDRGEPLVGERAPGHPDRVHARGARRPACR